MQGPLVSVVVPVYNAEKYLDKCIESLLGQSYGNLEIILVNDGSTDKSGRICEGYARKDSRVRVIHKDNGGVSDARNSGLKKASGKYLCFLDSDDYIETGTVEHAVQVAETEKADAVIWSYYADFVDCDGKPVFSKKVTVDTAVYSKKGARPLPANEQLLGIGYVWNKLYRTAVIKNNNFLFQKDISLGEDMLFNCSVLSSAEKIVLLETPYTHYMQRPEKSLGGIFYHNIFELRMTQCEAKKNFWEKWGVERRIRADSYNRSVFNSVKSSLKAICRTEVLDRRQKKTYMDKILRDSRTKNMLNSFRVSSLKECFFLLMLKHGIFRNILYRYFRRR